MTAATDKKAMRHLLFFATKADLSPGIAQIEQKHKLKYVRANHLSEDPITPYLSALDIPGLEFVTHRTFGSSPMYLVTPGEVSVRRGSVSPGQPSIAGRSRSRALRSCT